MNAFAVTYDLRAKRKPDYKGVFKELKLCTRWWHYLESTWLVMTDETASELWERLRPHVHSRDSVLIIEVRDNVSGWLPEKAWAWINRNVPLPDTYV